MAGRATSSTLDAAHGFLVECLIKEIQEYRSGSVRCPRTNAPLRCPAALYAELGKVLKANAVDRPEQDEISDVEDNLLDGFDQTFGQDSFDDFQSNTLLQFEVPEAPLTDPEDRRKVCNNCEEQLPIGAFNKNAKKADGLQTWCRQCQSAAARKRNHGGKNGKDTPSKSG